jgi:hypothetical protein
MFVQTQSLYFRDEKRMDARGHVQTRDVSGETENG